MSSVAALRKYSGLKPWQPGQSGNPAGRKPGSRNKLTEAFLKAMADDFEVYGQEAIEQARQKEPLGYIKTIASLCPKELDLKRPLEEMDDGELRDAIDVLQRFVSGLAPQGDTGSGGPEAA